MQNLHGQMLPHPQLLHPVEVTFNFGGWGLECSESKHFDVASRRLSLSAVFTQVTPWQLNSLSLIPMQTLISQELTTLQV